MTTHEIARMLTLLAQALRKAPNQSLEELGAGALPRSKGDSKSIPIALSTLATLSGFDKSQWGDLIADYGFPVEVRPRDSSRDILGKLLRYLEENPDARERLTKTSTRDRSGTSPELVRALRFLLDT